MEEMVQSMQQYKSKIDQLKQEKSSLSVTYEVMGVSCSYNLVQVHSISDFLVFLVNKVLFI